MQLGVGENNSEIKFLTLLKKLGVGVGVGLGASSACACINLFSATASSFRSLVNFSIASVRAVSPNEVASSVWVLLIIFLTSSRFHIAVSIRWWIAATRVLCGITIAGGVDLP